MKLIVFDVDGTLVDSGAEIARRVTGAFDALNLPQPSQHAIRSSVGLSLPLYMGAVAQTDDLELIDRLVQAYRTIAMVSPSDRMPLFAGAREALTRLNGRADTVLGVATGKGLAGLRKLIEESGLEGVFSTLQTPDHNPSKPHPGMLHAAMKEIGVGPDDTVMIGDAVFDIEMAKAAGVPSIGVSWGLQSPDLLRNAGASAIVSHFADIDAAIDTVLEKSNA